ncbi:MAG TPA: hypothetical protein DIV98_01025 [Oceanicaulis sp.]|nr:hypothetical protein [Oceanicaulis sp.]|tara:strand:- start:137 stop:373 length:237 start_codon:yes stop_codon:yes gene_type:complete
MSEDIFAVEDEDGNLIQVFDLPSQAGFRSLGGSYGSKDSTREFKTAEGEHLEPIGNGRFRLYESGKIVTKVEEAPEKS